MLPGSPVAISGGGNPSFLDKRQRHVDAVFETEMNYTPARAGDCTGLVAFADERHHYFPELCGTFTGVDPVVRRRDGAQDPEAGRVIAARAAPGKAGGALRLRISTRGDADEFAYAVAGGPWPVTDAARTCRRQDARKPGEP